MPALPRLQPLFLLKLLYPCPVHVSHHSCYTFTRITVHDPRKSDGEEVEWILKTTAVAAGLDVSYERKWDPWAIGFHVLLFAWSFVRYKYLRVLNFNNCSLLFRDLVINRVRSAKRPQTQLRYPGGLSTATLRCTRHWNKILPRRTR